MKHLSSILLFGFAFAFLASVNTTQEAQSQAVYEYVQQTRGTYQALVTTTVTSTASQLVGIDKGRNSALIQNKGSQTIYCKVGTAAPTATTSDIEIVAGGNWEILPVPVGAISCIAASGNNWTAFVSSVPY